MDAPAFRVWPPIAVGVPLLAGLGLSAVGDPFELPDVAGWIGWVLVAAFAVWNGWALGLMAQHRTGVLPGQPTTTLLDRGPFGISRNPLYVGLLALSTGVGLVTGSVWTLLLLPVAFAGLRWGAVLPEERYLNAKFGAGYARYSARVRRWL
jgi:protein-S-isoprenylcysteine O-methyltransferase Ste14